MIDINRLINEKRIRKREVDKTKIKSLIESAQINSSVTLSISLNEKSATVVFREIYESVRQLGDAAWWLRGYEPLDHSASLDSLKEIEIKEKVRLNFLDRFKQIRNDANYRGYKVTLSQAKEIIDFWNSCAREIIKSILSKL